MRSILDVDLVIEELDSAGNNGLPRFEDAETHVE